MTLPATAFTARRTFALLASDFRSRTRQSAHPMLSFNILLSSLLYFSNLSLHSASTVGSMGITSDYFLGISLL